jgi:hypothetical protein
MTAPTPDPSAAAREAIERALPCFLPCVARDDDGRHDLNCPAYRRRSLLSALAPVLDAARVERDEAIRELGKYANDAGALAVRLAMLREAARGYLDEEWRYDLASTEGASLDEMRNNHRPRLIEARNKLRALLSAQAQGGEDRTRPALPEQEAAK